MKIKTYKVLNNMIDELINKDFALIDDLLSIHADYYTVLDKTTAAEGVAAGVMLANLASKLNSTIVEVICTYPDGHLDAGFSAYFVDDKENIKRILKQYLKK